jgi:hypothetical protein
VKKGDEQKNAKKQTKRILWKLTPLMEIRTKRGFPPRLEKAAPTTLGFFTVSTSPTAAVPSTLTKSNKLPRTWQHLPGGLTRHPDAR